MTTNVNNSGITSDMYWDNTSKLPENNNGALTQSDFFALLTQQLAFQDPTKPVENDQMIAQMTNFTMADGISSLNKNFETLAASMTSSQALQASSLVGRSVLTQSDKIAFTGETLARGVVDLDKPANSMTVRIESETGELIQSFTIDKPALGKNNFAWDGLDDRTNSDGKEITLEDGTVLKQANPGVYSIKVDVNYTDGTNASLPAQVYTPVTSVSMAGSGTGISLNLIDARTVKLSDVLEVSYN